MHHDRCDMYTVHCTYCSSLLIKNTAYLFLHRWWCQGDQLPQHDMAASCLRCSSSLLLAARASLRALTGAVHDHAHRILNCRTHGLHTAPVCTCAQVGMHKSCTESMPSYILAGACVWGAAHIVYTGLMSNMMMMILYTRTAQCQCRF